MATQIGFVGLGIMGNPMSKNLLKAGYQVTVFNRTRSKMDELLKEGAKSASSPKEVAENSDITITMLTDSPDVEDVVLQSNGILEGLKENTVLIDMSTISPKVTQKIADLLERKGAHMLDAPVSGGLWGAVSGTLAIMVGGQKPIFDRCMPVFEAMGKTITYTGSHGMGQTTKLINQILVANTMNAVAEALVFAAKAGADLETTIEAVAGGAAGSWQLSNLGPRVIKGDFAPGFMVKLQQKDLRLILEAASEMSVALPSTSLVNQLFASLEAMGHSEDGTQALVQVHELLTGIKARAT